MGDFLIALTPLAALGTTNVLVDGQISSTTDVSSVLLFCLSLRLIHIFTDMSAQS